MIRSAAPAPAVAGTPSPVGAEPPSLPTEWVLAHCSDPHLARPQLLRPRDFLTKRLFGWLRWQLKRRREQDEGLLTTLAGDLQRMRPDHVAVTGDLIHLGLAGEGAVACAWLRTLGPAERVTVVPGNHDRYLAGDWRETLASWLPWLQGDGSRAAADPLPAELSALFPTLRLRPPVALIGCSTAEPTAPHLASGTLGATQLGRLATLLERLAGQSLCRVLLLHHPPVTNAVSWRRGLTDAPALQALIARHGVELVLFGHTHRTITATLPGPHGPVPVLGAPSVTARRGSEGRRSRYFLYTVRRTARGWTVHQRERRLDVAQSGFVDGVQREFAL